MINIRLLLLALLLMTIIVGCTASKIETYTASGTVTDSNANPVEAVVLHFSGGHGTSQTNSQGEWFKSGLRGEITVTPVKSGYVFTPPTEVITPSFAKQVNFLGEPSLLEISPTSVTLQVDETQEFTAIGRDKYGQPVSINPDWLVTGGIGVASPAQGPTTTFAATTPGEGTIVAEDGEMVVYAIVNVVPRQETYEIMVSHDIVSTPIDQVGGKVTATIDDETYGYGIIVTLSAVPENGWRFVRWEGEVEEVESEDNTIALVVIDPDREPIHPFGAGSSVSWRWPPPPEEPTMTYHPDIVAYGDTLPMPMSRTDVGLALEAKFVTRTIRAVFEKEY